MRQNLDEEVVETSPLLEEGQYRSHGSGSSHATSSKSVKIVGSLLLITGIAVTLVVFSSTSSSPAVIRSDLLAAEGTEDNGVSTETPVVVDTSIQVDVEEGTLQGARLTSRGGREYLEFRGIPYARPPMGEWRFKPPQPPEPWDGVRDAIKSQPVCIQKRSANPAPHGSEDCLYLNVFTPKTVTDLNQSGRRRQRQRNLLPVIFYVHGGGGGAEGDGSRYGGEYFMDEDIILVTIDYRLGVLGALNLNITGAAGNQGLKDQVMGLKWVQANIAAFGGDKSRVTLVGNSAGAHQVATHMLSPLSQPYVAGAIAQSGASILPGYFSGDPVADGIDLGRKLNCTAAAAELAKNVTRLLECFMNTSASDLVLNSIHLRHWFTFTYSVDSASEAGDVFLPEPPLARLLAGSSAVNRIPFMIGVTSAEGLPQALQVLLEPRRADAYNRVPWTDNDRVIQDLQLQLSTTPEEGGRISEKARQFYFDGGAKNVSSAHIQTLSNLLSDRLFHHPIYVTAQKQFLVNNGSSATGRSGGGRSGGRRRGSDYSNPPVYTYILSHKINVSRCQDPRFQVDTVWGIDDFGVCHADELQFFFPSGGEGGIYPKINAGHEYEPFSRMVVALWASFAAGGVPTGTTNNVTWTPINGTKPLQALELNENPRMVDFFPERMQFWDQFSLTDLYR